MERLKDAICEMVSIAEDTCLRNEFKELDKAGAEIIDILDNVAETRKRAIDEFAEKLITEVESFTAEVNGIRADLLTLDYFAEFVDEIAEQLKGE